ncbi:peptidoglycan DD-metalloendopeptidase family protein [Denitromonas iodatirespirans]|uniref:Peptidoglycan DD-metalloendopeptidase family protein n=1 Tax=Denitromonas iodatirespirans TaxID=2795389 RepID=A0A944HC70_DENI1|nr:peptidoglycan DD-metalloendopeptidase family protein [Denitromonas iodatirespirans]MBT0960926.1 peptidoglycan DD-metalloendopeptidase family protein [Denitromonas iodatirespirans]
MMTSLILKRCCQAAFLLSMATAAHAAPTPALVPGGIAHLQIAPASEARPEVRFADQRVLVRREGTHWAAWIGLPLDLPAGQQTLTVIRRGTQETRALTLADKAYPVQHIRLKNQRMVEPNPADLKRIEAEAATQQEIKTLFRDTDTVQIDFVTPTEGRRSSAFGLRRTFNGQPRAPHRGLDIAAATGTPVVAPAAGIVTHVGDFFFNGKTVFIDHGQGLISMFCHLDSVAIAAGTPVAQGAKVATVGQSGRATGPHLHWSVFLNGTPVDPALFLP